MTANAGSVRPSVCLSVTLMTANAGSVRPSVRLSVTLMTANAGSVRPSVRPSVCHTHDQRRALNGLGSKDFLHLTIERCF